MIDESEFHSSAWPSWDDFSYWMGEHWNALRSREGDYQECVSEIETEEGDEDESGV
jgi:hypothetical protein